MLYIRILQGGCTILHFAAQCGFIEIIELLIEQYGMDPACEAEVCMYVHMYVRMCYNLFKSTFVLMYYRTHAYLLLRT